MRGPKAPARTGRKAETMQKERTHEMYDLIAFSKWNQNLPLPELAKSLKELGFDGADLPCRPNAPVTHANGPRMLAEVKRIFEDHGLRLGRLVTNLIEADAEAERLLEAIREVGVRKIRIGCQLLGKADPRKQLAVARRKLVAMGALLEKHGVMGAVQNHSGPSLAVNVSSCLLMLRDCDPQWVGVQYDPGHCTLSGEPVSMAAGLLGPYLHSVNIKNPRQEYYVNPATGRLAHKAIWVPLRDGLLDVAAALKALCNAGYRDALSLHAEYRSHFHMVEHDIEATNGLVAQDVAYLRELMAGMA